jgi:hypothetical protein
MNWETEILEFYKVKYEEQLFYWKTRDDAILDFTTFVIPALEDVQEKLKPFVKRVNIVPKYRDRVFSANLSFEEKNIGKSAFEVETELNSSYIRISTYHDGSDRSYFLRLDSDRFLTTDVIINEFMVFFRGRSKVTI